MCGSAATLTAKDLPDMVGSCPAWLQREIDEVREQWPLTVGRMPQLERGDASSVAFAVHAVKPAKILLLCGTRNFSFPHIYVEPDVWLARFRRLVLPAQSPIATSTRRWLTNAFCSWAFNKSTANEIPKDGRTS